MESRWRGCDDRRPWTSVLHVVRHTTQSPRKETIPVEGRERTKAQNRISKGSDQRKFSSLHRVGVSPSIEIRVRPTMIVIRFCCFQVQLHHDLSSSLIESITETY